MRRLVFHSRRPAMAAVVDRDGEARNAMVRARRHDCMGLCERAAEATAVWIAVPVDDKHGFGRREPCSRTLAGFDERPHHVVMPIDRDGREPFQRMAPTPDRIP